MLVRFSSDDLFSGVTVSDCLLPCVRTVATVEEGTVTKWDASSMFSLMFNHEVKVKKTSVDKFNFYGFSQFLRVKPGTVAWNGIVSDNGVDGWDISCQSVF